MAHDSSEAGHLIQPRSDQLRSWAIWTRVGSTENAQWSGARLAPLYCLVGNIHWRHRLLTPLVDNVTAVDNSVFFLPWCFHTHQVCLYIRLFTGQKKQWFYFS